MKEFKDILLEKRKALGLSQFELGMLLDTSQAVIGKWELGDFYPNFSSLNKIADVFKCSVDELMGRDKPGVKIPTKMSLDFIIKLEDALKISGVDWELKYIPASKGAFYVLNIDGEEAFLLPVKEKEQ